MLKKTVDKFGRNLPKKLYLAPNVATDALVLHPTDTSSLLFIKRKNPPFQNCWAFPGGFIDYNETPLEACVRELREETGLVGVESNIGLISGYKVR